MPLPIIGSTYRCTLNWSTFDGITPRNVLHVRVPSSTESAVGDALVASLSVHQFEGMPQDFELETVTVLKLDGVSAGLNVDGGGYNSGSGHGEFSPASAIVASLRTGVRGPRGRGRCYIGPVLESVIANGLLPSANADEITGAWVDFIANFHSETGTGFVVVASYAHASAADVTDVTVSTVLGTQRRRQDQLR